MTNDLLNKITERVADKMRCPKQDMTGERTFQHGTDVREVVKEVIAAYYAERYVVLEEKLESR